MTFLRNRLITHLINSCLLEFKSERGEFIVGAVDHELHHVVKTIQHKFDIHYESSLIDQLHSHVYPTPIQYIIGPRNVLSLQFPFEQREDHENEPLLSRP